MSMSAIDRLNAALSGRYRIESELGEGGMATVYLADDIKHERKVALKVLKPELAAVVGAERFLAEIKTTANLTHPHILPLHDSGEADSFLYYVMPYIEGETLRERIDRDKQLPVDEALGIATAVANALHTAHEHGVVHRDIKPGNILLQGGEPVVADFGIALAVGAASGTRLTETGLSVGTPYYMSPEQATGDQTVGPASDTFALACVLYEMLVGEPLILAAPPRLCWARSFRACRCRRRRSDGRFRPMWTRRSGRRWRSCLPIASPGLRTSRRRWPIQRSGTARLLEQMPKRVWDRGSGSRSRSRLSSLSRSAGLCYVQRPSPRCR